MGDADSTILHTIFQIYPSKTDTEQLLAKCHFAAVSRWALDVFVREYEARKADAAADFYHDIEAMPGAGSLTGYLFERQVLNHLSGISEECEFSIRRLTDSEEVTWTHPGGIDRVNFQESTELTFSKGITDAVERRKPVHLVPSVGNFAAVDSIFYDPDDPDATITCIQITMNKKHPVAVSGLRHIQSCLRLDGPLEGLRPTSNRKWRFLFVVPSRMSTTFKSQRLKDDTLYGEWAGKVDQYVLGLDDETLFGRTFDSSAQLAITPQEGEQQVWR
jgi:hypothetical protein